MPDHPYVPLPPFTPGLYRHYKGGLYNALLLALHTETDDWLVVYVALQSGNVTARPLSMWNEQVEVNGQRLPRFARVEEA